MHKPSAPSDCGLTRARAAWRRSRWLAHLAGPSAPARSLATSLVLPLLLRNPAASARCSLLRPVPRSHASCCSDCVLGSDYLSLGTCQTRLTRVCETDSPAPLSITRLVVLQPACVPVLLTSLGLFTACSPGSPSQLLCPFFLAASPSFSAWLCRSRSRGCASCLACPCFRTSTATAATVLQNVPWLKLKAPGFCVGRYSLPHSASDLKPLLAFGALPVYLVYQPHSGGRWPNPFALAGRGFRGRSRPLRPAGPPASCNMVFMFPLRYLLNFCAQFSQRCCRSTRIG